MNFNLPVKPKVSLEEAKLFLCNQWKLDLDNVTITELGSYDSRTYLIKLYGENKFIFKIINSTDSSQPENLETLVEIFLQLDRKHIESQRIIPLPDNGKYLKDLSVSNGEVNKTLLLSYVSGKLLKETLLTENLCFIAGKELARVTNGLDEIRGELPYLQIRADTYWWTMDNATKLKVLIDKLKDKSHMELIERVYQDYERHVLPNIDKMTKGIIHGDANEANILVQDESHVVLIDWHDSCLSYKAYDLAILIISLIDTYFRNEAANNSLNGCDVQHIATSCIHGYNHQQSILTDWEINLLPYLAQMRMATSLLIGSYTYYYLDSSNPYVLTTATQGWNTLDALVNNINKYFH